MRRQRCGMKVAFLLALSILCTILPSTICSALPVFYGNSGTDAYQEHGRRTGLQRIAIVLTEFVDIRHTKHSDEIGHTMERLDSYYRSVSYGQISLTWFILGWYVTNETLAFYGSDLPGGQPGGERGTGLIKDAVRLSQKDLAAHEFDHLAIVHAGKDQRISNVTSDLWPHYWNITMTTENGLIIQGAFYVSEYDEVGAYAHEFGHSLGLPDLYPHNKTKRDLVGEWSLMDSGDWLGQPPMSSPSGLDAWSLTQLGWVKPDEVVLGPSAITFRIMALETKSGTRVVKFSLQEDLYYLLELRLRRGVDIDLSTEALLVSLINRTALYGYDGYGVVNSTALLTSNPGRTALIDTVHHVFVELVTCNDEACVVRAASVLVEPIYISLIPDSVEALAPIEISAAFADANQKPLRDLDVTLFVDEKPILLKTDDKGEIRYTLTLYSLGRHRVSLNVTGIMWPALPERIIEARFPITLLQSLGLLTVFVVIVILLIRRRRIRRPRE